MAIFTKNWKSKGQIATEELMKSVQPEVANSVRIITVAAFKQRFNVSERYAVKESLDLYTQDIWDDLNSRLYINLDNALVAQGVGYVLNVLSAIPDIQDNQVMTVLDPSVRLTEILVDALDEEIYRGIL